MVNTNRLGYSKQNKNKELQNADLAYMQQALTLALKGQGYTSPNPAVGAVVVRDDQVVGEGYHRVAGGPHAEVEALRATGKFTKGSTLYVTLEPCSHYGRTPPCTEAIIAAGIQKVVYAIRDPNPLVSGRGHRQLVDAGISVTEGVGAEQAWHLNRFFFHYITTSTPYTIAKYAMSLDGKIATRTGDSQWISGNESRKQSHRLRHLCDAILIGAGTACIDNPRLTTRVKDLANPSHPIRIVLDSRGRVPLDSNIFNPSLIGKTVVASTNAMPEVHKSELEKRGVELLTLPNQPQGGINLQALLKTLGEKQIISLLVEGGGEVLGSFFTDGLVDEVWTFIAPIIIGGDSAPGPVRGHGVEKINESFHLQHTSVEKVGEDFLIKGYAKDFTIPFQSSSLFDGISKGK